MKALTLTQPWATLIACGAKRIETRSWSTPYRGRIAIHAAKGLSAIGGKRGFQELCATQPFERVLSKWLVECGATKSAYAAAWAIPLGAIVATANLVKVLSTDNGFFRMTAGSLEMENGRITSGSIATLSYEKPAPGSDEHAFGDYSANRYMWFLEDVRRLAQPIECKGALSLWDVPPEIECRIREAA